MARNEASIRAAIEQLTKDHDTSGLIGLLEARLRNEGQVGYWDNGTYADGGDTSASPDTSARTFETSGRVYGTADRYK